MDVKETAGIFTSIVALVAAVLGLFKYFEYQTKRDKVLQVRDSFNAVVKSLSADSDVERMAGAILLRRFFDARSEVGIAGVPYAREAVDVSAAILRGYATGNVQKLLADGLAFAPSLERADLQRTNLQFAYLGPRRRAGTGGSEPVPTDLRHADFYRADLSGASLKGANARGAVFYQARLSGTVLTGADLREAYFYDADLAGAKFERALLAGANFHAARSLPAGIAEQLDASDVYTGTEPFSAPAGGDAPVSTAVFLSKPGCIDASQEQRIAALRARLTAEGFRPQSLERADYPSFGAFAEVQRVMSGCAGAVIFGFEELTVHKGVWRPGTAEQKDVSRQSFPTPWTQIEAGMATMLGLPIFIVSEAGVSGGVFDSGSGELHVYRTSMEDDWNAGAFARTFADWSDDVRDRGRSAKA